MFRRIIGRLWAATVITLIASPSAIAQYYEREHLVKDLSLRIEWMRCSVGQRWDEEQKTCWGEAVRLNHDEIAEVI